MVNRIVEGILTKGFFPSIFSRCIHASIFIPETMMNVYFKANFNYVFILFISKICRWEIQSLPFSS